MAGRGRALEVLLTAHELNGETTKEQRIVNEQYDLNTPDKYTIQVHRFDDVSQTEVKSNTIAITVAPAPNATPPSPVLSIIVDPPADLIRIGIAHHQRHSDGEKHHRQRNLFGNRQDWKFFSGIHGLQLLVDEGWPRG